MKWNKEEWKKVELKNCMNQVRGVSYSGGDSSSECFEGSVAILRSNNIEESRINFDNLVYVSEGFVKESQFLQKNDILITASTGSIKVIGKNGQIRSDTNASFGAFCKVVRPNKEIHPRFLGQYFQSQKYRIYIRHVINGANINNIKKDHLDLQQIPLPPLQTQKEIAELLDTADALRQKTQAQIDALDELARSVFLDMFGDTWNNPKGWPWLLIENLAEKEKHAIKAGPFGSSLKKSFYVESGYKIYGQEQVIKDDFDYGDYYIDDLLYEKLKSCKVKSGDILVSLVGTYGKIAVVPEMFKPGIINPRLMKITPDTKQVRPDFLKTLLRSNGVEIQLKNKSRGGTMDIVNVGIIRKVKVPLPPLPLQNQFATIIENIEAQKTKLKESLRESEDLFGGLMQEVFG